MNTNAATGIRLEHKSALCPPFWPISCYSQSMAVTFTPSQLSFKQETSPISFRISPFQLLRSDSKVVASLLGYVPLILAPLRSGNPRSELNLRYFGNVVSVLLQVLLVISTLVGFTGLGLFVFLPIPGAALILYAGIYVAVCGPSILAF